MHKLKYLFTMVAAFITLSALTIDAYALYRAESETAHNAFSLSRILYVDFDAGGGSGNMTQTSIPLNKDTVLPDSSFSKQGYHFTGWSLALDGDTLPDINALIDAAIPDTQLTLYAVWAPNNYTVSFHDNESDSDAALPSDISCVYDTGTDLPDYEVNASDRLFLGWCLNADGNDTILSPSGKLFNLTDEENATVILYAQWEDESDGIIETNWNKQLDTDNDNNGTPDRMELKPNTRCLKDPSVKNHNDYACFCYAAVYVPTVSARFSNDAEDKIYDIAVLNTTPHWKLIYSKVSDSALTKSLYIYRYDTVLEAYGSLNLNSYHSLRHADRSTDVMSSFRIQDFEACPALEDSIDIEAMLIEAVVPESEADELAKATLDAS